MNKNISEFFNTIPDKELIQCLVQLQESDKTGFIQDTDLIRTYQLKTKSIDQASSQDFFMITIHVLKQAASRWLALKS